MSTKILGRRAQAKSRHGRPGFAMAMIACLVFGGACALTSWEAFSDLRAESQYASLKGQVLDAQEERTRTRTNQRERTRVRCKVTVSYAVGGTNYRIRSELGGSCNQRAGNTTTVRYDPAYPARATLANTAAQNWLAWGGAAGAALSGGVAPVVLAARAIDRRRLRHGALIQADNAG